MDRLYAKARAAQILTDDYIATEAFSADGVSDYIIELNTEHQLFMLSIDSKGNLLPEYSLATQKITGGEKIAGTNYTLRDTGVFYRSFNVSVDSNGDITITANTLKTDAKGKTNNLLDISPFIIGLTDESKTKLARYITPIIQEITRRVLVSA